MSIRRDGRGQGPIVAVVLVVVLFLLFVAIGYGVITWLQPKRYEICGTDTEGAERLWLEVVLDSLDPGLRNVTEVAEHTVQILLQYYSSNADMLVLVNSGGHDVSVGRAYLYEMSARYFVAIGLFVGCSLTNHAAQGYQKEVQDDTAKLAVLIALAIVAPESLSFFTSVEFLISMIFGWQGYLPGIPSISQGPQLFGLEPETMPNSVDDNLVRQDDEYFSTR